MILSQSDPAFREIEPHAAGFSQGVLVSQPAACRHVSVYVRRGGAGDADFQSAFDLAAESLSKFGLSLSDTVAMTVLLSGTEDIARFRQVRMERLVGRHPASTVVIVEGFDEAEKIAAMELVAARDPGPRLPSGA